MTDIAFSLLMLSLGVLSLSLRFLPRAWLYVLVPLYLVALVFGISLIAFRVRVMAPVSGLVDFLIVFAGVAMLVTNSILDWRARAKAKQTGPAQPQ